MSNKTTKNNRIRDFLKKTFGPAKVLNFRDFENYSICLVSYKMENVTPKS